MATIHLGKATTAILRVRFEEVNRLDSEQSRFGQYGYIDQKINNDWHTFRSGAINMLKIQQSLLEQ